MEAKIREMTLQLNSEKDLVKDLQKKLKEARELARMEKESFLMAVEMELEKIKKKHQQYRTERKKEREGRKKAEKDLETMKDEKTKLEEEMEKMKQEMKVVKEENVDLRLELPTNSEEELRQAQDKINKLTLLESEWEELKRTNEETIRTLKSEKLNIHEALKTFESGKKAAQDQLKNVKTDLTEAQNKLEKALVDTKYLNAKVASLTEEKSKEEAGQDTEVSSEADLILFVSYSIIFVSFIYSRFSSSNKAKKYKMVI